MKNNNTVVEKGYIGAERALALAAESAGIEMKDLVPGSCLLENGYYAVEFTAFWMRYECYVDARTGEVPGLLSEPFSQELSASVVVA